MALAKLESTNPKFSHILLKNPGTQAAVNEPFSKKLRKGRAYGWYGSSAQEFIMLFQDAVHECSFTDGRGTDFEYLDQTRYNNPFIPASLIVALLNDSWRKLQPDDVEGFDNCFTINAFYIHRMGSFERAFRTVKDRFDIELTLVHNKVYKLKISTKETIQSLLSMVSIISFQQSADLLYIPAELGQKYMKMLNIVQAPFYLRHIFARYLLQDFGSFNKSRDLINGPNMDLKYGNTRIQRFEHVKQHLRGGSYLIDIGCGELWQAFRLAKVYENVYACDLDPEIVEANNGRIKKRCVSNIIQYGGFEESVEDMYFAEGSKVHVLATEVLEHMTQDEAAALLEKLKADWFSKAVITVPNRDFNKYYGMADGEMRHDDHKWEPTMAEFQDFIKPIFSEECYSVIFENAGDAITEQDGNVVSTSICAIIQKKEDQ